MISKSYFKSRLKNKNKNNKIIKFHNKVIKKTKDNKNKKNEK